VLFTVRDERVARVLARDNLDVDDGWLCDKGRFGYQMTSSPERITAPMIREAGNLREASWREAIDAAAAGLRAAGADTAALVGSTCSNEEGYLVQRIAREALGSPHVDSGDGGAVDRGLWLELARPELAARTADIDDADAILVVDADPMHAMPIIDLRIRKALRHGHARLAVASARPTALDGGAAEAVRYAPGDAAAFCADLAAVLGERDGSTAPGAYREAAEDVAAVLGGAERVVVVWGGGLAGDPRGGLDQLVAVARELGVSDHEGAGLLEVPAATNARGLREVGVVPTAGPGYSEVPAGKDASEIRRSLDSGSLSAVVLAELDPVRLLPEAEQWRAALAAAEFVVAFSMFEDGSTAHADVVFPAESYAEKDGTVTHPDGRLQRLRPVIPHPDQVRIGWEVLVELSAALGHELGLDTGPMVLDEIGREVPFYAGITHEEIGGTGVRWQDRDAASALPKAPGKPEPRAAEAAAAPGADRLRLGTYRDLWAAEVTERSPALRFLAPRQTLELAPADAERLGVGHGEEAEVSSNGTSVSARVAVRSRMRAGAAFLISGTEEDNANALAADEVEIAPAAE
jgi:NADH-quinone oxidoreductase subunit G